MRTLERMEDVRAILGEPNPLTVRKIKPRLNARMSEFIARSPLLMLSTVDRDGYPSVSPKGDGPGFVKVRDDETLLIPERKGNRLAFTFENLLARPQAGLIFLVPGTSETLRVQGRCRVLHDEALCRELASASQPALLAIEIKIANCYFHCAKAFLRSAAWRPEQWGAAMEISFGAEIHGEGADADRAARELDAGVRSRYVTDL